MTIPNVGDRASEEVDAVGRTMTGKVVFVHPTGRFYTVEFETKHGKIRENYFTTKTKEE